MIYLLLLLSAFAAGAINALAGGGSFFTFPALIFAGVPAIAANATSTVALVPASFASAFTYRHDIRRLEAFGLRTLLLVSLAGGLCGSVLLVRTPETTFVHLIPWLLLFATAVFAFGKTLSFWLRERLKVGPKTLLLVLFVVTTYGGYFGGGMGIMTLALLGLWGLTDLHAMNGAKNVLAGSLNGLAVIVFIFARQVYWKEASIMVVASIAGGYAGAKLAKRIAPARLRVIVIAVGCLMTAYFFWRG
jgi:uncharacterized membrane protein YfcA